MKTWQQLLRENDPAATPNEARLEAHEVEALRRAAVTAAREPRAVPVRWQQPLAMAAVITLMIGVGAIAGLRVQVPEPPPSAVGAAPEDAPAGQRQLQFATPGGTRIIWVFNPEFDLKETMP